MAAEKMKVDVKDGLPGVLAAVDHQAVAIVQTKFFTGKFRGHAHDVPDERIIRFGQIIERGDLSLGDHEHMRRCLGVDVLKRQALVVFVDDVRWNLTVDDLFEKGLFSHALYEAPWPGGPETFKVCPPGHRLVQESLVLSDDGPPAI